MIDATRKLADGRELRWVSTHQLEPEGATDTYTLELRDVLTEFA